MKILIYGAGVIGSIYAARLHEAGQDITVLARGERLEQLREHGVVLEDVTTGERTVAPVKVVNELTPDDEYELVLVIMQCTQVPSVLPALTANENCETIAFLGNSVAGEEELLAALDRRRVLRGFGAVGGARDGHVVRYFGRRRGPLGRTVLGELDGQRSARLINIAEAFADTDLPVAIEDDIDGWLKSHAAFVVPLALALYHTDGDIERLARTRDGVVLALRAAQELFEGLKALGVTISPTWLNALEWIPEPFAVTALSRFLRTSFAKLALAGHASVARPEMTKLAEDLAELLRPAGVDTPSFDQLLLSNDPAQPPMVDGRRSIPMSWRGVWVSAGALIAALLLIRRMLAR